MSIKQRRQSIQLTDPQTAFLNDEARALGITVAELIRRIIDEHRFSSSPWNWVAATKGNQP